MHSRENKYDKTEIQILQNPEDDFLLGNENFEDDLELRNQKILKMFYN